MTIGNRNIDLRNDFDSDMESENILTSPKIDSNYNENQSEYEYNKLRYSDEYQEYCSNLPKYVEGIFEENELDYSKSETEFEIKKLPMTIKICGELFYIERENDKFSLSHDKWSIKGIGKDLFSAIKSLREEALEIKEFYIIQPINKLTLEAIRFKDFLLDFV